MKNHTGVIVSSILTGLFFIGTGFQGVSAADDDAAKLQSLERAVSTSAKGDKKKFKTRAIVFDAEPTVAAAPAAPDTRSIVMDLEPQAVPVEAQKSSGWDFDQRMTAPTAPVVAQKAPDQRVAAVSSASKTSRDCNTLPADFSSVTVDFALQFDQGRAEVASASEPMLREIAKILSLNREACILVVGHNDAIGNPYLNMDLTQRRANWVVNFVAEKSGMDRSRLVPIGMGSIEPLKNLDPRDPKNRRVVFMVVG